MRERVKWSRLREREGGREGGRGGGHGGGKTERQKWMEIVTSIVIDEQNEEVSSSRRRRRRQSAKENTKVKNRRAERSMSSRGKMKNQT